MPRPADFGRDWDRYGAALKEWGELPEVVADAQRRAQEEQDAIDAARPENDCPACELVRPDHPRERWGIRMCSPHLADWWAERHQPIVPKRYATADPAHLLPALAEWDGTRSLYLAGPVGTGKTYQAAALVRAKCRLFGWTAYGDYGGRGPNVKWANVPRLLEDLRCSFDAPDAAPSGLETTGLLVLDDLGAEKPSEWVEERLYCIVNDRYEAGLPVIVTSNLTPSQLGKKLGQRLVSRLAEMCDVHGLGGKDRRLGPRGKAA